MSSSIDQLAVQALALPANERMELLDRLVESLGDPSADAAWAQEARRRRDEVRFGRVESIVGEEAIRLARQDAAE